ncbi:LOW QUALITY PROTEIN: hypothetical protein PHMEG_00011999 [Phytophthora megakarya]|uniref:Chromo domain-containing protein n=1 Tax=Phytophthora megakarya TaxID=4795 RepID=A0A225W9V2_9STRA|nr:LOW QUALITY PROTEIN: hypothetical protein PHMEG_00011999 [Phytophthora megakarya]
MDLLAKKPWYVMFANRPKYFYFHLRKDFSPVAEKALGRHIKYMKDNSRTFWDVLHGFVILLTVHSDRSSRHEPVGRGFEKRLERIFNKGVPGTIRLLALSLQGVPLILGAPLHTQFFGDVDRLAHVPNKVRDMIKPEDQTRIRSAIGRTGVATREQRNTRILRGRERDTARDTGQTDTSSNGQPATGAVTEDSDDDTMCVMRSVFDVGSRVWLYMERVKPGLTKQLAHRWHGPFRIKKKRNLLTISNFLPEVDTDLPMLRLKAADEFGDRQRAHLTPDVIEASRLEFDEELLPEDSWEPDLVAVGFKVEAILDDRTLLPTGTERAVREFKVGYDDPTWEPASNLSCGVLRYDYFRDRRRDQILQMVQVAGED